MEQLIHLPYQSEKYPKGFKHKERGRWGSDGHTLCCFTLLLSTSRVFHFLHSDKLEMSRHPEVKWAERVDKLYITVLLADAKDAKVNLEPEGTFTFSAATGAGNQLYELKLDLLDKVNVEESKINIGVRTIFCVLAKAEKKWWKKLLAGDAKTPHYVKVDWDKWADEDDDTAPADMDTGGMDFSKFGDMGGMGGLESMMGGMGGMGGLESMMGGMGGMGGYPTGDDLDDSGDEDEEGSNPQGKDADKSGEETKPTQKAEAAPTT